MRSRGTAVTNRIEDPPDVLQMSVRQRADEPESRWQALLRPEKFSSLSHRLLLGYCCVAALSIGLTSIFVLTTVVYWIAFLFRNLPGVPASASFRDRASAFVTRAFRSPASAPAGVSPTFAHVELARSMRLWLLFALVAAFLGLRPEKALFETFKLGLYLCVPFCVFSSLTCVRLSSREFVIRIESYLACLIAAQSVAAMHTVFIDGLNAGLPRLVPGPVTESGQLTLILPLLAAAGFLAHSREAADEYRNQWLSPIFTLPLFVGLVLMVWPQTVFGPVSAGTVRALAAALVVVSGAALLIPRVRPAKVPSVFGGSSRWMRVDVLVWPASALLFAAFVVNLKRGPWFGVFLELLLLGLLLTRKSLLTLFGFLLLFFIVIGPTRERISAFSEHFSISGGRKNMWELGADIAQRYPLGVGLSNASYMRQIDPTLPELHRHMHNNLLNVAVETGWLGMAVFCWWMVSAFVAALSAWRLSQRGCGRLERQFGVLALCLGTALVGWQAAGLVEYNFGDGEVRTLALFTMGVILSLEWWITARMGQRQVSDRPPTNNPTECGASLPLGGS